MGIFQVKDSPYWHYSFKLPGKTQDRGTTRETDKKLATLVFHKKHAEARGQKNFGDPVRWTVEKLLDWTWSEFWSQKLNADKHERDLALRAFLRQFKNTIAADITAKDLRQYRREREQTVKMSTTNRELTYIRFAYNRAIEEGILTINPLVTVKRVSEKSFKRGRNATPEEQAYLFDKSSGTLHKIIRFALATGMRLGEIRKLKRSDVDFDNTEIRVDSMKGGDLIRRFVPIYPDALEILKSVTHSFPNVFHNGAGKEIPEDGLVHSAWPRLTRSLGIENLTFHDLRHTFATELWRKTRDIVLVHKILGHEKIDTTMTYLNLKATDLRPAKNYHNFSTVTDNEDRQILKSA